ncbi:MAG: alpha/beta fold hydrolase [Jatrophihabitantaceae bacterium]
MKIADGYLALERPDARLRVLMFHHAGGSAMSYLPIARQLPDGCEPLLFELPGRGLRSSEPLVPDFTAAVAELLPKVIGVIDRPVLIFGHSLGAILAHSLVAGLPADQRALVRTVVVSAYSSPADAALRAPHPAKPFQVRTWDGLVAELRVRDGSPAELFDDPELLELTVNLLGHDLHLADTYRPPAPIEINAEYQVWRGREDPRPTTAQLAGWAEVSRPAPTFREFAGGHFYLLQSPQAGRALAELTTELSIELC